MCNTNHRMLQMKRTIGKKFSRRGTGERLVKRFAVAKLQLALHPVAMLQEQEEVCGGQENCQESCER